jgi:hypothetical protein
VAERGRDSASAHPPTPDHGPPQNVARARSRSADASAMAAVLSSTLPAQSARHGSTVPTQFPGTGQGITRRG